MDRAEEHLDETSSFLPTKDGSHSSTQSKTDAQNVQSSAVVVPFGLVASIFKLTYAAVLFYIVYSLAFPSSQSSSNTLDDYLKNYIPVIEIELAISAMLLGLANILQALCGFSVFLKTSTASARLVAMLKLAKLCKTLGLPWLMVSLGGVVEECEVSKDQIILRLFYDAAVAFVVIYTLRELIGFVNHLSASTSTSMLRSIGEHSILFGGTTDDQLVKANNTEAFGLLLLGSLFIGFWIYQSHSTPALFLTTIGIIGFNVFANVVTGNLKHSKTKRLMREGREVLRNAQQIGWMVAVKYTHLKCKPTN